MQTRDLIMMFAFDPTIKLGDILTIASFLGIGISAYYNIKGRLDVGSLKMSNLAVEVEAIKETLKVTSSTLTVVATQKVEIDYMKQDIFELKHGHGFVLPFPNKSANTSP